MNISNLLPSAIRLPLTVVALLLGAFCFPAVAQAEDIFEQLSSLPSVESTYVSGRFAHNKKRWFNHDGSHSMDLSDGFSSLYSYQCYSEESVKMARKILSDYLKKNKDIEVVMRSKQGAQEYVVYEKFKDNDILTQLIIWSCDARNVCEVVVIDWDKGLRRPQNPYESSVNGLVPLDDALTFGRLSDLSQLSQLSQLGRLSQLSELSELDEIGETIGTCIGEAIGGSFEAAFSKPEMTVIER